MQRFDLSTKRYLLDNVLAGTYCNRLGLTGGGKIIAGCSRMQMTTQIVPMPKNEVGLKYYNHLY